MSEEEQLSNIINVILSPDNEARKKHEALLAQLLEKDVNQYMLVFLNLLNSNTIFLNFLSYLLNLNLDTIYNLIIHRFLSTTLFGLKEC